MNVNDLELKVKRLRENATLPIKATPGSSGYDLTACITTPVVIKPGEIYNIPLGIATEPSSMDVTMFIYPRSGIASKHGVTLVNSVGVIDSDYRGEWCVSLINLGTEYFIIEPGMRIAQLVVMNHISPNVKEVTELSNTMRGLGGFGSTGV